MSEYETATIKNIPEPKELVRLALKIRENAYVPYSGFHVELPCLLIMVKYILL